jgi:hypothetical protein
MTELKKCVYCNHMVGITNSADYYTHSLECKSNPENLPCRRNKQVACEQLVLFLRVRRDDKLFMRTVCQQQGCFKSLETTLFPWWEPGVPESGPLLDSS